MEPKVDSSYPILQVRIREVKWLAPSYSAGRSQPGSQGELRRLCGSRARDRVDPAPLGDSFHVVFKPREDTWNGAQAANGTAVVAASGDR